MELPILQALVVEQHELLAADIAAACGEPESWVLELVQAAILEPLPTSRAAPGFRGDALFVAQRVRRLQRELGLNLEGAALALELLARIDTLQDQLRRAGIEPEPRPGA